MLKRYLLQQTKQPQKSEIHKIQILVFQLF